MKNPPFYKFNLSLENNVFDELSNSIDFEPTGKGRLGNHLVKLRDGEVPLVRTTTKYTIPAHQFYDLHNLIAEKIDQVANSEGNFPNIDFDNALIEIYDPSYRKMKYHSDQCLDLADDSYIALFSCYDQPEQIHEKALRKLKVKSKITDEEFEFSLTHNSVILFSMATNTEFMHKIVMDSSSGLNPSELDHKWLGITFRKSKTAIHFKNNLPYFANGELLTLADETEQKVFYQLRGEENKSMNFLYPTLNYTLSVADTIQPKNKC